ncbi:unnamed protein product [Oppiella nova]|uniref:Uncharacterized protein n=1 Tax=Oppiella nova TaxID=334625 RepID=A0A7R9QY37_9ACAR|nr:unnamed protein product [Oppiella nova]CAG2178585.1 unnamed protein product [Oppiella nova]
MNLQLETIERICYTSPDKTRLGLTDCDVILCNIDLDNSLVAILRDAFTTKVYTNGKSVKKMKFHSSLAPFKVGIAFRDNVIINEALMDLTNHLIQSLRLFDIPVLPFTPNKLVSIEQ